MSNDLIKSRFTVPIAVAVATHAFLFLGFTPPEAVKHPPIVKDPMPKEFPPVTAVVLEPPRGSGDDSDGGGRASSPVPSLPELPPLKSSPDSIPVPVSETPTGPFTPGLTLLPNGPIGWEHGGPGDGDGPITIRHIDLDEPPRIKFSMRPEYPYSLRMANIEGEVLVDFIVDEAGRVTSPRVVRSSTPGFEDATLRAIAKWRFEPGKRKGGAVRFRMTIPIVFSIGE